MGRKKQITPAAEPQTCPERPADQSYDAFHDWVTALLGVEGGDLEYQLHRNDPEMERNPYFRKQHPQLQDDPHLAVEWCTSGVSGGSCYGSGDERHYTYTSGDLPAELTSLDHILEKLKPDLSFLAYRRLTSNLVVGYSRSVDEYYGNSTNYAGKKVQLRALWEALVREGLL